MQLFCGHAFDKIVLIYLKIIFKFEPFNVVVMLSDWGITSEVIVTTKRYRNNSVHVKPSAFRFVPFGELSIALSFFSRGIRIRSKSREANKRQSR